MKPELYGRFRIVYEYLDPKPHDNLLSVGCKRAEFESKLSDAVCSITAVDIDKKIIDENKRRMSQINFVHGDIVAGINVQAETFDKVLFLEVIEHLPSGTERKALKDIHRALKKGGCLIISAPNDTLITRLLDPAYWLIRHRHYSKSQLEDILLDSGFDIEAEQIGGGIVELVWIPIYYILIRLKLDWLFKPGIEKTIDNEYKGTGFYTIIVRCRKKENL